MNVSEDSSAVSPARVAEPEMKSHLFITDSFIVHLPTPKPNLWRRFWYWFLLGWKWRDEYEE